MLIDLARIKIKLDMTYIKKLYLIIGNSQIHSITPKLEDILQYFVNGDKTFEIIQDEVF